VIAKGSSLLHIFDFSVSPHEDVFKENPINGNRTANVGRWEQQEKNQLINEKWGSTFLYLFAEGGSRRRLSLSVRYIFVFDADQ
jgi:hypothetical protein